MHLEAYQQLIALGYMYIRVPLSQRQMEFVLSPPYEIKLRLIVATYIHDVMKGARARYENRGNHCM